MEYFCSTVNICYSEQSTETLSTLQHSILPSSDVYVPPLYPNMEIAPLGMNPLSEDFCILGCYSMLSGRNEPVYQTTSFVHKVPGLNL
jgi:hypothetical protein